MKLSPREQAMLAFLLIVAILAGSYYFLITPQLAAYASLQADEAAVQLEYDTIKADINHAERTKASYLELDAKIKKATLRYYPSIIQEKIILALNDLAARSSLATGSLNYSFAAATQSSTSQASNAAVQGNLAALAASYQLLEDGQKTTPATNKTAMTAEELAVYQTSLASLETLSVSVQFTGSFENLTQFIKLMEALQRTICITKLNVTQSGNNALSGTMELSVYAIPKLHSQDDEYATWTISGEYGRDNPFISAK